MEAEGWGRGVRVKGQDDDRWRLDKHDRLATRGLTFDNQHFGFFLKKFFLDHQVPIRMVFTGTQDTPTYDVFTVISIWKMFVFSQVCSQLTTDRCS